MAELINVGDSYYRVIDVTVKDEDNEKIPYDLTDYQDNYVAIKVDRGLPDEDSYIFKRVPMVGSPKEGKLLINLSPEETSILPSTVNEDVEKLFAFVQIGSSITGQIHEVAALKLKTRAGGIVYQTRIDKSYDMGCLSETIGWIFDGGDLCEPITMRIDFGMIYETPYFDGGILGDTNITIFDMGELGDQITEYLEMGHLAGCGSLADSC